MDAAGLMGNMSFDGAGGFTFNGQQVARDGSSLGSRREWNLFCARQRFCDTVQPLCGRRRWSTRGWATGFCSVRPPKARLPSTICWWRSRRAAEPLGDGALTGPWWVAHIDFPAGSVDFARNSIFRFDADGAGAIAGFNVIGRAMNMGDRPVTQAVSGATYDVNANGSGTLRFPLPAGADPNRRLLTGDKAMLMSSGGDVFVAGSGLDFLIGVRAATDASAADYSGLHFAAGLRLASRETRSFTASVNSNGAGTKVWSRRIRHAAGVFDFTGVNSYVIQSDGSGTAAGAQIAVGANSAGVVGAGVSVTAPENLDLYFAIPATQPTGDSVFLNPNGIVNAASFAPVGNAISPGAFITLFGSGLAPSNATATNAPFPTVLNSVRVLINDVPAPIYAVSAGQISVLVPQIVDRQHCQHRGGQQRRALECRGCPGISHFTGDLHGPTGRELVPARSSRPISAW